MRKRWALRIDRHTGEAIYSEEILSADASVEERFAQLHEGLPEAKPEDLRWMAVVCNGCGATERVELPELPPGWVSNPEGEFCPACEVKNA